MNAMFSLIFFLLTKALILAAKPEEELIKNVIENANDCKTKLGLTMADLMQFGKMEAPDNMKSYCYLSCTAKSLGLMTEDNKFNKEKVSSTMAVFKDALVGNAFEKFTKVIDACMVEVPGGGTDECAVAKAGFECILKNGQKEGVFQLTPHK